MEKLHWGLGLMMIKGGKGVQVQESGSGSKIRHIISQHRQKHAPLATFLSYLCLIHSVFASWRIIHHQGRMTQKADLDTILFLLQINQLTWNLVTENNTNTPVRNLRIQRGVSSL